MFEKQAHLPSANDDRRASNWALPHTDGSVTTDALLRGVDPRKACHRDGPRSDLRQAPETSIRRRRRGRRPSWMRGEPNTLLFRTVGPPTRGGRPKMTPLGALLTQKVTGGGSGGPPPRGSTKEGALLTPLGALLTQKVTLSPPPPPPPKFQNWGGGGGGGPPPRS